MRTAFALALLTTVAGCGGVADGGHGPGGTVLILAAASTRDALRDAADVFTRENGSEVRISAGASSRLATQIAHDSPGDLFLSASEEWADFVRDKGFADRSRLLLGNELVLITPRGNPAGVSRPQDLTGPSVKRLALAARSVPAGAYAREALRKLGLWDNLEAERKVVPGDDVRATLTYVERGEAQAGIVYATDARLSNGVEVVYTFPASTHEPIRYPLVLLRAGRDNDAARRFYDFLLSPRAAEVFRKYGFTPLTEPGGAAPVTGAGEGGWLLTAAEWSALRLSLLVAVTATLASLPLGVATGWLLARRRFRGKAAVETLLNLPLVLPPVVTGYLLLVLLGRRGWVGHWLDAWFGVSLVFTWQGAAVASAVMAFPLMVRAIRLSFAAVDTRLEQAARTLGAGPLEVFWRVSLPLARRGVIAGAVLAFARSLGEFGATIMLAGNIPGQTQTIPLYIYSELGAPGGLERGAHLVVACVVIAAAALVLSEALERGGPRTTG